MKNNPLNDYSIPTLVEDTKLGIKFTLNYRDSKNGRIWIPLYNEQLPLKFKVAFTYVSKIFEKNNESGNHYHKKKQEIIFPVLGSFEIYLEDVHSKDRELIVLDSKENQALFIPVNTAHKVISKEDQGIFVILASSPSAPEDELKYVVK